MASLRPPDNYMVIALRPREGDVWAPRAQRRLQGIVASSRLIGNRLRSTFWGSYCQQHGPWANTHASVGGDAYGALASSSQLATPYLLIYRVRAEVLTVFDGRPVSDMYRRTR
ncbi:MAG: hypothetical protein ACR2IK_22050 [Chloroflexota bacterium]